MNYDPPRVLLVEDTASLAIIYCGFLTNAGIDHTHVTTVSDACQALEEDSYGAMLLDLVLPDGDGVDILKRVVDRNLPISVVVITANGSINRAVEAMQIGAHDFLVKPFGEQRMITTMRNALERSTLRSAVADVQGRFARNAFHGFIGGSLAMQNVYKIVESTAGAKAPVCISGEAGTGKGICAEAVHKVSARRNGPFIKVDCAQSSPETVQAELFDRPAGAIARADGGTLFLDNVLGLSAGLQTRFLQYLDTPPSQKVTDDVRIICATPVDPGPEVEAGRFNRDLAHKLHVVSIELPPLCERGDDIMELAETFLHRYAERDDKNFVGFNAPAEDLIRDYSWPRNVGELKDLVKTITANFDAEEVTPDMLPDHIQESPQQGQS